MVTAPTGEPNFCSFFSPEWTHTHQNRPSALSPTSSVDVYLSFNNYCPNQAPRRSFTLDMESRSRYPTRPSTSSSAASTEVLSPLARHAVRALSIETAVRETNESSLQYGNSPFLRTTDSPRRPSAHSSVLPFAARSLSPLSRQTTAFDDTSCQTESASEIKIELSDIRVNLICSWLYQKQLQSQWSSASKEEGVMVKKTKEEYVCCPAELSDRSEGLYSAVKQLNVKCAMTVNTRTTQLMLDLSNAAHVPLSNGLRVQVLPNIKTLFRCQKNQFAAFIQDPPMLIVWDDDPAHIVERIQDLESQMMSLILRDQTHNEKEGNSQLDGKTAPQHGNSNNDLEAAAIPMRRTKLIQPFVIAATLAIMCGTLAAGWRNVAIEIKIQNTWSYLGFAVIGPLQAWLGLFFFQTLPTCIAQIVGPVRQMRENSRFFSGEKPRRLTSSSLPHVTVQCPVYKESLSAVIEPTIKSVKAAISTYEMQGGTANIFVNDDGMQLISESQGQERREFYDEHNIGWIARPRHNIKLPGNERVFRRAGKFKKASNMNYGLDISIQVESKLSQVQRSDEWTAEQESNAYDQALADVIAENEGHCWAAGNVRIGDYILLIDSDTRVPRDCLLDAVSEMEQSPQVAIIQFSSGVMNVTKSWFEKGITFFTHLVYTAIEFAVANGDVAPFVGHNAMLRWSALQDVAFSTPDQPSYQKFWSEDTVSEDFDMALRLQTSGYILRFATYTSGGFKEGVSLTVYDELARWEKYAFGCSELIFNPFAKWIFRGPFTPLFRRFIFSSMPFHSKVSIFAYVGTYFAIGSSWLLILLNYFAVGWYNGYLDHYYIDSFKIYFSTVVVFNLVGNIALAILRYRIDEQKLLSALFENFKWMLLLATFLGGISLHVSQAILCHLFSIDMSWGATSKEASSTSFFREIPIILRKFRFTFTFCLLLSAVMVVLSGIGPFGNVVPFHWQINNFTAIFPLALLLASHALLPLALNPGLMQFTF